MGMVSRLGKWLDTKFPDKVRADEIYGSIEKYDRELDIIHRRLSALEDRIPDVSGFNSEIEKLKGEIEKLKALAVIKPKGYTGNMNMNFPMPPVMPGPVK